MSVEIITKDNFDEKLTAAGDKLVIVDFYADWCGPCKMLAPVLDQIAQENADLVVYKINTDENPEAAQKAEIVGLPTMVSYKNGVEHKRVSGVKPKAALLADLV